MTAPFHWGRNSCPAFGIYQLFDQVHSDPSVSGSAPSGLASRIAEMLVPTRLCHSNHA